MVNDDGMKVTDKRMFNAEGELREEFRSLGEEEKGGAEEESSASTPAANLEEVAEPSGSAPEHESAAGPELDVGAPSEGTPSFYDLVAMLAEPVALYLGEVKLSEGESVEDLEMARIHIDLLKVLKEKTEGNLSADEAALLDDLVYRFQMRYVQKRG